MESQLTNGANMENSITKFEAGKTYTTRSIGDNNCIWNVKVIKRTAKFLTIKVDGEREEKRMGINVWNDEETCLFSGRYSMAPSIRAGKEKAPDSAPEAPAPAPATPVETPAEMPAVPIRGEIINGMQVTDVVYYPVTKKIESSKLQGFAKITLNDQFIIHGVRVYEGVNGPFMQFPQDMSREGEPENMALCHPTTAKLRQHISDQVLAEYSFTAIQKPRKWG